MNQHIYKNIFFGCLLLFLAGPVPGYTQNLDDLFFGFRFLETVSPTTLDARSAGMGRTTTVSVAGPNALFSNPSLLATLESRQFQVGGQLLFGSIKEVNEDNDALKYGYHPKLTHIAFAMPYEVVDNDDFKTTFGVGFQTYYDWGFSLTLNDGDELSYSGGLNLLSLGAGLSYEEKYFAGLALHRSILSKINEKTTDSFQDTDIDINTSASFFSLGGLAHFTEELTIGLMYRTGFDWKWSINLGGLDEGLAGERPTFDIENAGVWGLGATYQVSEDFKVAGEVQNRPFSDLRVLGVRILNVDDGLALRVGGELQRGNTPIRFGLFRDAKFAREISGSNPVPLLGLTGGIGLDFETFALDTAIELAQAKVDGATERIFRLHVTLRYVLED